MNHCSSVPSLNQNGQTIIQVLVACAIAGILTLAIITIIVNLSKDVTALEQRLASTDLQRVLESSLSDGTVCQYITATAQCPGCKFDST